VDMQPRRSWFALIRKNGFLLNRHQLVPRGLVLVQIVYRVRQRRWWILL
jgi:hypothetical protein